MFVSYNRMEMVPEPARSELIKFITHSEVMNLKYERYMRRSNLFNWIAAPLLTCDVLWALWQIAFNRHGDTFSFLLWIVTVVIGTYAVRMEVRGIVRYRLMKAHPKVHPWDDYVAWDEIPAKLRRGGAHAQPSRRTRQAR